MRDLRPDARRLHELDHLVDRLENVVALAAHVRRVIPALRRCNLGERHDFRRRRILAGLVDEPRREAPAARIKRFVEKTRHLAQVFVAGRARGITDDRRPQRIVADELNGVDRGLRRGKHLAVLGERTPGEAVAQNRGPVRAEARLAITRRNAAAALSVDLRRDALRHLRRRVGLNHEIGV